MLGYIRLKSLTQPFALTHRFLIINFGPLEVVMWTMFINAHIALKSFFCLFFDRFAQNYKIYE